MTESSRVGRIFARVARDGHVRIARSLVADR